MDTKNTCCLEDQLGWTMWAWARPISISESVNSSSAEPRASRLGLKAEENAHLLVSLFPGPGLCGGAP